MDENWISSEARRIGEKVAGPSAADVDRDARLPIETIEELRGSGLLGALVPARRGGPGASMGEVSGAVAVLAEHCASSALILAMHQIQVASLLRHASTAALDQLVPPLLRGELLIANANSEVGLGGDRRSSSCALEPTGTGFHLEKQASTVSYGECADAVLSTARRDPSSPPNDQALAICLPGTFTLTPTGGWDTLGLRGTCSKPCQLVADLPAELVVEDYASVFARSSLPVSAVLLSSVWWGIAEGAARRAHGFVRAQARKRRAEQATPATATAAPTGALRLAELGVILHQLRQVLVGGAAEYERSKDTDEIETFRFSNRMDNLKLSSSTLAGEIVQRAMLICGLAAYQNASPYSLARTLRDVAAAPLMVNNDRALQASAETLLISKEL